MTELIYILNVHYVQWGVLHDIFCCLVFAAFI